MEAIRAGGGTAAEFAPVGPYVLLNGEIVGSCKDPQVVADAVRELAPPGILPYAAQSVYVCPCDQCVYIRTDEARVVRPLLRVAGGWTAPATEESVDALVSRGAIRYVDAAEVAVLDLALDPEVSRQRPVDLLEVHAHLMLGVTAALIPLLQANQSPRNAYQTSMGRFGVR